LPDPLIRTVGSIDMKLSFRWPIALWFLIFSLLGNPVLAAQAKTAPAFELAADKIFWQRLSYRAESFIGKMTSNISLATLPEEDAADNLITAAGGCAVKASGARVFFLESHSNIKPLFGSNEIYTTQSWIDSNSAAALQRIRRREGREMWQKSYRFMDKGVFRLKKKPKDSREAKLPLDKWTQTRESFYDYAPANPNCSAILEPGGLLLVASVIKQWQQASPLNLCVFNKKQLYRVNVSLAGIRRLKVKYIEKSGIENKRRDTEIDAFQISFEPQSLEQTPKNKEEFSFLGLKGGFDIFVDPRFGLPVQIRGKIAAVGKINISLQTVEFAPDN